MARRYVKKENFGNWLKEKVDLDGKIRNFFLLIEAEGFSSASVQKCLDELKDEGLLTYEIEVLERPNPSGSKTIIESVQLKNISHHSLEKNIPGSDTDKNKVILRKNNDSPGTVPPPARPEQPEPAKDEKQHTSKYALKIIKRSSEEGAGQKEVAILIDYDNFAYQARDFKVGDVSPASIYERIAKYAECLGKVALFQFFVTTSTENGIKVIQVLYELGVRVNIVPPGENAADKEISAQVDFLINHCPKIKHIILAGNDGRAFENICNKIKQAGKEDHVVTPSQPTKAILQSATKTVSFIELEKIHGEINTKMRNPFMVQTQRLEKMLRLRTTADMIKKENALVQFLFACREELKRQTYPDRWLTFKVMKDKIWSKLKPEWEPRQFMESDCEKAISALSAADLIQRGTVDKGNGIILTVYFQR